MNAVKRDLTSDNPELIAERDSRSVVRAVVDLLKKGINEQVHPVRMMFNLWYSKQNIDHLHVFHVFHSFKGSKN